MGDDLPQQTRLEQASAATKGFAVLLADYFKALRKEGFTRNEALELVLAYQTRLLAGK